MPSVGTCSSPRRWRTRELSTEEIAKSAAVLPEGVWLVKYESTEAEREKDLTVAEARVGS